jgi:HD-GYP domain-containing protein (c-di-GMP phosphodiesterase class II)
MCEVKISEVKPGMVLEKPLYSMDKQKMLLSQGTILKTSTIKKLMELGMKQLDIADEYTLCIMPSEQMAVHLRDTYIRFIQMYSSEHEEGNLNDSMASIVQTVMNTVEMICRNDNILDFCVQMKIARDSWFFDQGVLTSVFSGLLAGSLGLLENMYDIMAGALLHNIGCLEMPFLIGKRKKNRQEDLLWKEHPQYGYYFAIQQNIPRSVAEIILKHHENWDGSGYPKHLKGDEIPLEARIVHICSTVSFYIYYDHMRPYEAMEVLYCTCNKFDIKLVEDFMENIPLYPLGAMVRLTTGEVGIISNVRKNRGPRPVIYVYYNRFHKPLSEPHIIDLGVERTVFISEILG